MTHIKEGGGDDAEKFSYHIEGLLSKEKKRDSHNGNARVLSAVRVVTSYAAYP